MRILILVHEFPPIGGGGGRAAYDIGRELVRRGHQVTVLTAHMRGMARRQDVEGLQVIRLPSLRRYPYQAYLLTMSAYVAAAVLAGLRIVRRERPDVLHAHFAVPAGAAAALLSRLTGIPYVLTVHLGDVPGGVPEKTDRWFSWILPLTPPIWRGAARIVAVSDYTRRLALQHYPVEMALVPNGADLERLRPQVMSVHEPPRVVFAGRFVPQKNPMQVVKTLAGLADLPWQCTMLGDGPLLPEVRREIGRRGLQGRIEVAGWVPPEQVLEWYGRSDILFMPSLVEGLPVSGVQALATGLAMVVSDVGGFADLVEPGHNGFLIEPGDERAFSTSLQSLLADPGRLLQFRRSSLHKAAAFDISHVGERYESLLEDVRRRR